MEERHSGNMDPSGLNKVLVDELKQTGSIQSLKVEAAFRAVLRHVFLPGRPLDEVYSDRAIAAKQDEKGQWLSSSSQPAIMAIMLEQLGLEPGHKVLEIGAGTGYNAALMAHIVGEAGQVITIDIDEDLTAEARRNLVSAGFEQVQVVCADGGYGYPDAAPFDRIILTVGAPDITPAWWSQLKPEGRIVLPLIFKGAMKSIAFELVNGHLASRSVKDCGFIPLRGDFASSLTQRLPIGRDPGLYVESVNELSIDTDATHRFLAGDHRDWATGVEAAAWDVMAGALWTWLALHEPQLCKLVAEDAMIERDLVPPLIGIDGKQRSVATVLLPDETGLAAVMRPPDQPAPLMEMKKLFAPGSPGVVPFELFVRQFGSDEAVAQRLIGHLQDWEAAGRPTADKMHIRAYPKSSAYVPSAGEYLIEKQWTKLVVEWPLSA